MPADLTAFRSAAAACAFSVSRILAVQSLCTHLPWSLAVVSPFTGCAVTFVPVAAALPSLPQATAQLDPSQVTIPYVVQNAKAVAGIGVAVLAFGFLLMVLLSLLGNCGLAPDHSADDAYAPAAAVATVQVHAHKRKVRRGFVVQPGQSLAAPTHDVRACSCTDAMSAPVLTTG